MAQLKQGSMIIGKGEIATLNDIPNEANLSKKADIKYVDEKVKTNVPVDAVFTDTIATKESLGLDKVDNVKQETPEGAQIKADKALADAKVYTNEQIESIDITDEIDMESIVRKNELNMETIVRKNELGIHTNNLDIHVTPEQKATWNAKSEFDGKYTSLTGIPESTTQADIEAYVTPEQKIEWSAKSDFSGDYKDLVNKPEIPEGADISHLATKVELSKAKGELVTHADNSNIHVTPEDRGKWDSKSEFDGRYVSLTGRPDYITASQLSQHASARATTSSLGHVIVGDGLDVTLGKISVDTSKISFKAKEIDGLNSINTEIGLRSSVNNSRGVIGQVAIGDRALTNITHATAIGSEAKATGGQSVALGFDTNSSGISSVSIGNRAESSSNYSIAIGSTANASEISSIAIGNKTESKNREEGVLGGNKYISLSTNKWLVPGDFSVSGTKNFEMPHPNPEKTHTHTIRHAAVESASAGDTLYRYVIKSTKNNDKQIIELPDYFIHLNKDVQLFVTPQGHFGSGYGVLNRSTEQLEIHCQSKGDYNVLIIGTRNDSHPSIQEWDIKGVERENGESWTGETYAFDVLEIYGIEEIKEEF